MAVNIDNQSDWLSVIGKSLAYLCLENIGEANWNLQKKAQFLESLGLNRADVAEMLGTSSASIAELHRQAKKKGGRRGGRNAKKK